VSPKSRQPGSTPSPQCSQSHLLGSTDEETLHSITTAAAADVDAGASTAPATAASGAAAVDGSRDSPAASMDSVHPAAPLGAFLLCLDLLVQHAYVLLRDQLKRRLTPLLAECVSPDSDLDPSDASCSTGTGVYAAADGVAAGGQGAAGGSSLAVAGSSPAEDAQAAGSSAAATLDSAAAAAAAAAGGGGGGGGGVTQQGQQGQPVSPSAARAAVAGAAAQSSAHAEAALMNYRRCVDTCGTVLWGSSFAAVLWGSSLLRLRRT
jgi:hypothetical protein